MYFGSPEFVLAIIGMAMFAGVVKTAIRAKHGLPDFPGGGGKRVRRGGIARLRGESSGLAEGLGSENKRLVGRVESMEDRLIVLEPPSPDGGYTLAQEIAALRDARKLEEEL